MHHPSPDARERDVSNRAESEASILVAIAIKMFQASSIFTAQMFHHNAYTQQLTRISRQKQHTHTIAPSIARGASNCGVRAPQPQRTRRSLSPPNQRNELDDDVVRRDGHCVLRVSPHSCQHARSDLAGSIALQGGEQLPAGERPRLWRSRVMYAWPHRRGRW